jgi:hypothetical protein
MGHAALVTTTAATDRGTSTTRTGAAAVVAVDERAANVIAHRSLRVMMGIVALSTLCATACLCGTYWSADRLSFLLLVTAGCLLIFLCNPAINMGLMLSVPLHSRPLALALTSVCVHIFGDVPSPVLTGILKDFISPGCAFSSDISGSGDNGSGSGGSGSGSGGSQLMVDDDARAMMMKSQPCQAQKWGIRATMLLVSMWLLVAFLFYCAAWYYAHRAVQRDNEGRRRCQGVRDEGCCCFSTTRRAGAAIGAGAGGGAGPVAVRVAVVSSSRDASLLKHTLAQPLLPDAAFDVPNAPSLAHTWT